MIEERGAKKDGKDGYNSLNIAMSEEFVYLTERRVLLNVCDGEACL